MYRSMIRVVDRISAAGWMRRLARSALVRAVVRRVRDLENIRSVSDALAGKKANLRTIERFILGHTTKLRMPLVLISEVQRSGGTLLSQLFDGHPDIAAHPHEIKIGHPTDEDWPPIDPAYDADRNFHILFDSKITEMVPAGYAKGKLDQNPKRHRFFYVPRLQYAIFRQLCSVQPPATTREILNHFLSGFFNAWLNYQGDLKAKRFITAFGPCLANHEHNVAAFFKTYPDGRIIQVLRDPMTWYPSATRHRKSAWKGKTVEQYLDLWRLSAEAMLRNKARYGSKVIVVQFEDLIGDTERAMRALAGELDIAFDPILLNPTFNSLPVRANSSFAVDTSGVLRTPLARQNLLTAEERAAVEQQCYPLYDRARALALATGPMPMQAVPGR